VDLFGLRNCQGSQCWRKFNCHSKNIRYRKSNKKITHDVCPTFTPNCVGSDLWGRKSWEYQQLFQRTRLTLSRSFWRAEGCTHGLNNFRKARQKIWEFVINRLPASSAFHSLKWKYYYNWFIYAKFIVKNKIDTLFDPHGKLGKHVKWPLKVTQRLECWLIQ